MYDKYYVKYSFENNICNEYQVKSAADAKTLFNELKLNPNCSFCSVEARKRNSLGFFNGYDILYLSDKRWNRRKKNGNRKNL